MVRWHASCLAAYACASDGSAEGPADLPQGCQCAAMADKRAYKKKDEWSPDHRKNQRRESAQRTAAAKAAKAAPAYAAPAAAAAAAAATTAQRFRTLTPWF